MFAAVLALEYSRKGLQFLNDVHCDLLYAYQILLFLG